MKCCDPHYIRVPDYDNGSYIGTSMTRWMAVPCGKCWFCLQEKQRDWIVRLLCEQEISEAGYFITLTYNDENLRPLNKKDLQKFMHAFRQWWHRNVDDSAIITYYACGEYGRENNRPHYHLQLFGLPYMPLQDILAFCERFWSKGFVYVKRTNMQNVAYITKYMSKLDPREHDVRPFFYRVGDRLWDSVIGLLPGLTDLIVMEFNRWLDLEQDTVLGCPVCGRINFYVRKYGNNFVNMRNYKQILKHRVRLKYVNLIESHVRDILTTNLLP